MVSLFYTVNKLNGWSYLASYFLIMGSLNKKARLLHIAISEIQSFLTESYRLVGHVKFKEYESYYLRNYRNSNIINISLRNDSLIVKKNNKIIKQIYE